MPDKLIYQSASQLARAIRAKEISSEELVRACLHRISEVNPKLGAVVQLAEESALKDARLADADLAQGRLRGPLHGVPMTIKDNLDTAGIVTTGGTEGRAKFVPAADATAVQRMRAAGAILLGKTNTPELTLAYETDNLVYGRTNNPYDLTRTCGGSSGGAAAILAAGGSPIDVGSDTGGSIRFPSHCCGTAGIRPTSGRVPRTGHILPPGGYMDSMTQLGPMSRFVEDLELVLPILAGPDGHDPAVVPMPLEKSQDVKLDSLRVAFYTDNGIYPASPDVAAVVKKAASALSSAGAKVEEARPTGIEQTFELGMAVWSADGGVGIRMLLEMYGTTTISPLLQGLIGFMTGPQLTAADFAGLLMRWDMYRSAMLGFLRNYDLIICPAHAHAALPHGQVELPEMLPATTHTLAYNLTGWPGAVVRCGTSGEGLPIGAQIVARPWREHVALRAAKHLESALGGWQPPLSAEASA